MSLFGEIGKAWHQVLNTADTIARNPVGVIVTIAGIEMGLPVWQAGAMGGAASAANSGGNTDQIIKGALTGGALAYVGQQAGLSAQQYGTIASGAASGAATGALAAAISGGKLGPSIWNGLVIGASIGGVQQIMTTKEAMSSVPQDVLDSANASADPMGSLINQMGWTPGNGAISAAMQANDQYEFKQQQQQLIGQRTAYENTQIQNDIDYGLKNAGSNIDKYVYDANLAGDPATTLARSLGYAPYEIDSSVKTAMQQILDNPTYQNYTPPEIIQQQQQVAQQQTLATQQQQLTDAQATMSRPNIPLPDWATSKDVVVQAPDGTIGVQTPDGFTLSYDGNNMIGRLGNPFTGGGTPANTITATAPVTPIEPTVTPPTQVVETIPEVVPPYRPPEVGPPINVADNTTGLPENLQPSWKVSGVKQLGNGLYNSDFPPPDTNNLMSNQQLASQSDIDSGDYGMIENSDGSYTYVKSSSTPTPTVETPVTPPVTTPVVVPPVTTPSVPTNTTGSTTTGPSVPTDTTTTGPTTDLGEVVITAPREPVTPIVVPPVTTPPVVTPPVTVPPLTPPTTVVIPPNTSVVTPVTVPEQPPEVEPPQVNPPTAPYVPPEVVVPKDVTPKTTTTGHYSWGTPYPLHLAQGLNPGLINPPEYYKNTNPAQAKYYWGQHPFQPGDTFNSELYNTVPNAPAVPYGLGYAQRAATPEEILLAMQGHYPLLNTTSVNGPVVPTK